jgi:hypothetical protein
MKKNLRICTVIALMLSIGCANKYLKPTSTCQPLSVFEKIVIAPISGDNAFVEEEQYKGLPRDIAAANTEQLKEQIEDSQMFKEVIQSPDCVDGAIKIDGKIYSLIHHRGFHVGIRGQIINCRTGERLYKFDNDDEQDSKSIKIPRQIAEDLTKGIRAKLKCEKPE